MVIRAVIYTRISLDHTGEGAAVSRQEKACRALCAARGWTVVEVCTDDSISAFTDKHRPGWEHCLEMVQDGEAEVIMAWALDRITRSIKELERVIDLTEETGVRVATVTGDIDLSTDTGRLVGRILAAVARAEVERKAVRQKAMHEQRAKQGKPWWSHRPFGYTRQGKIREDEAQAVREAVDAFLEGSNFGAIASDWNTRGIKTPSGGKWTSSIVSTLLSAPRIAGILTYHHIEVGPGNWPAIISEEKLRAVQVIRKRPERFMRGHLSLNTALLTGIIKCEECKSNYGQRWFTRGGERVRYYQCRKGHGSLPADWIEEYAREWVRMTLESEEYRSVWAGPKVDVAALTAQRAVLEERQQELVRMFTSGAVTGAQLEEGTSALQKELEALAERTGEAMQTRSGKSKDRAKELLDREDSPALKELMQEILGVIWITPSGTHAASVGPDQIHVQGPVNAEKPPA